MKKMSWAVLVLALLAVLVVPSVARRQAQGRRDQAQRVRGGVAEQGVPGDGARPSRSATRSYKNVKFVFNFQGTDTLVAQIEQGAPADVFAGASIKYGTKLVNEQAHRHADATSARTSSASSCRRPTRPASPASAELPTRPTYDRRRHHHRADRHVHRPGARQDGGQRRLRRRLQDPGHGQVRHLPQRHPGRHARHARRGRRRVLLRQRRDLRRHARSRRLGIADAYQSSPLPTYPHRAHDADQDAEASPSASSTSS